jgi:hypothetical protein
LGGVLTKTIIATGTMMTFEEFFNLVNLKCITNFGIDVRDLPDIDFQDYYDPEGDVESLAAEAAEDAYNNALEN